MHIHCINRSLVNKRAIPDASNVVIPASISGSLEVVMQRRVEDAKL
jgi:hypothetical protein